MTALGAMAVFSSSQMCAGKYAILSVVNPSVTIEMKDDMELSKKAQLDLSSAAEPVKLFDKPAARPPYDKPSGNVLSAEKSQIPRNKPGWKFRAQYR